VVDSFNNSAPWVRKVVPIAVEPAPPVVTVLPPPVVAMAPPAPPPAPVAPAPDFTYLGRIIEADKTMVFLATGDNFKAVAVGAMIDSDWRLEGVSATALKLRYLPLNERKDLPIGHQ
jgi:hypothetical protein